MIQNSNHHLYPQLQFPQLSNGADPSHFVAQLEDPEGNVVPVTLELNPEDPKSILASYVVPNKGPYKLSVGVKPEHLPHDSPHGHVLEGPFDVISQPALSPENTVVVPPERPPTDTDPTTFIVEAKDDDGEPLGRGGDDIVASVEGPDGEDIPVTIDDKGDGTYGLTYKPKKAGPHKLRLKANGEKVASTPISVEVEEGADEEQTYALDYTFTIRTKTKSGAPKLRGGDIFTVEIEGKDGLKVEGIEVEDKGDGCYFVSYSLPVPGKYKVSARLNGKHIKSSPWKQSA